MGMGGIGRWLLRAALGGVAPLLIGGTGLTTNLDHRILAAHNRERAALGVPQLRWNPALAASARSWADYLGRTGAFRHDLQEDEGENLWAGTRGHYSAEAMVGAWVEEKKHFRPGAFPHNSSTGQVGDVGHYTQVAWRRTHEVGCALAKSAQEDVLVCRYAQAGNIIGERPF